ncbi:hypothetical protein LTR97_009773 [Elasticomyces elasticus]|uniref:PIG-P domain-containing protein n=1 Tax=Elasticomyces elasticus TaxID=574655 RepID=A0AAN7W4S2_9PEZI|nr:hypothetical protein LTR97_009773 [Elasticomyces elasticus]
MPPHSRGEQPKPLPYPASKSTPNLPTLRSLQAASNSPITLHPGQAGSPDIITSPSEPASIEDLSLDRSAELPSLSPASSDEEDASGSGEDEDGYVPNLPPQPFLHHHSRSHTYLAPSAFAPPFYNRPPTPLPPSPSLTSLLRPNFSSASRPTTPDPSSDEGSIHPQTRGGTGTQTPTSTLTLTSSANPIPRASPKVPTYEYYGFTLYLTSSLAFIVYLLWSYLPSPFLHQLGIYYYPNRWWALAIPAWTVMLVVYIYVALACYNTGYLTLKMADVGCLVDEAANVAVVDAQGKIIREERPSWEVAGEREKHASVRKGSGKNGGHSRQASAGKVQMHHELDWRTLWKEGTDAVMDIPIGGVCEILYGHSDDEADELEG